MVTYPLNIMDMDNITLRLLLPISILIHLDNIIKHPLKEVAIMEVITVDILMLGI
jgi:hypothetical protein